MKKIFTLILLFLFIPALCYAQSLKAKRVRIEDAGTYYTGTEVETALQEIGAGSIWDSTLYDSLTWGDGSLASFIWTYSVTGTNPTLTFGDAALTLLGTFDATTLTEGGNAVYNSTETPGGELGNTWASPTIDDNVAVTSWNLTTPTITTSLTTSTPTTLIAAELDRLDGLAGTIVTDATACTDIEGRSLTISGGALVADPETYTTTKCIVIETPADADDFLFFRNDLAMTVTSIDGICENATSAVVVINECDSAGDNCGSAYSRLEESVTCDVDGATDDGTIGNPGIAVGAWLRAQVGTVTGTPGHVTMCVTLTRDD